MLKCIVLQVIPRMQSFLVLYFPKQVRFEYLFSSLSKTTHHVLPSKVVCSIGMNLFFFITSKFCLNYYIIRATNAKRNQNFHIKFIKFL